MNGFLEKNSDEKSKENQEDLADYIIAKIEAKKKDVQILKVHWIEEKNQTSIREPEENQNSYRRKR